MKQDHRRVSMEKHEIAYCRKLARLILKVYWNDDVSRVCKSYLKVTKGYTRKKWKSRK